ncbi:MAG: GmrSD restriction endonuclease domain-containing protein [Waterburya sp.]
MYEDTEKNELRLNNLKKLKSLNGFTFNDLPLPRQRRFQRTTIRMIQLTEEADEEVRRDLFERINTGSVELNDMEKRRGSKPGKFLDLIEELSKQKQFRQLCSFTETEIKKRDPQEFVLRFFAFLNNYQNYSGRKAHEFLDNYLERENKSDSLDIGVMRNEFISMLNFVQKYFPDALHKKNYYKLRKE